MADGKLIELPQHQIESFIKHAPKLTTETGNIDWTKNVDEIYNLIRGLSPYPAAYTFLDRKILKIFSAEKIIELPDNLPGTYKTDEKTFLHFACNNGYLNITNLQLEGKKKMEIKDFLRGYRFTK